LRNGPGDLGMTPRSGGGLTPAVKRTTVPGVTAVTDLASWLLAEIDADEQLARRVEEQVGAARAGEQFPARSRIAAYDDFPSYPWSLEQPELEFVARWHPRTVLAELEATRRIVRFCTQLINITAVQDDVVGSDDSARAEVAWETLRLLALPYADRDGYREEWHPQAPG
jgi:uncharacterized protein DUF6221